MHTLRATAEPEATTRHERRRFGRLGQSERVAVKRARLILAASGNCQLYVIKPSCYACRFSHRRRSFV